MFRRSSGARKRAALSSSGNRMEPSFPREIIIRGGEVEIKGQDQGCPLDPNP
jgi:hypothetical protein